MATKPARLDTLPDVIPQALERYRDKVLKLAQMGDSRSTSRVQMARARSALRSLLGDIPLQPDYENRHLVALMGISEKALALV